MTAAISKLHVFLSETVSITVFPANDDRDYLLLASGDDPMARSTQELLPLPPALATLPSHTPRRLGQRIFFDLGASSYNAGLGGASQSYFFDTYAQRGLAFDRMLLWEVRTQNHTKLLREVPGIYMHGYQYFNTPATPDPEDPKNPLNILKSIARPEDFVVFKLDIDNNPVETAFIEQILRDASISNLIDEFFFEHHVTFEVSGTSARDAKCSPVLYNPRLVNIRYYSNPSFSAFNHPTLPTINSP